VGLIGNLRSIRSALTGSAILLAPTVPLFGRTAKQQKEITNTEKIA